MIIESLQRDKHHRIAFRCGNDALDRFIQEHAHQAAAKGLSKTYVAVEEADETAILGYYTITTCRIEAGALPREIVRALKLPAHEIPASLVARLAVAEPMKGRGIGSLLLVDAMVRCARVSSEIGGVAIVVDALDESVVAFYDRLGFRRFEPRAPKMFIPMATVRTMLEAPQRQRQAG